MFAETGRQVLIKELGEVSSEEFRKYQLEKSLIVRINNVKFRRQIDATKDFRGRIRINQVIQKRDATLFFFKTNYDFEEGKATGEIELALVK